MATVTANTGTNNWNTNAAWVGGVQPTAANDVVIPSGATVTIASGTTALCRSCTVQTSGTLAFAATTSNLNIGDGTAGAGNVAFSCSGTLTLTAIGTINFVSTSATQQTILSGGTMPNVTFNGVGGKWLQSDALTATNAVLTHTNGTWATGGFAVIGAQMVVAAGTKTWTPGASIVTLNSGTTSTFVGTGYTVSANTAVIVMSNTGPGFSATGTAINWNGLSLVFSGITSGGNFTLNSGTFANVVFVAGAARAASPNLSAGGFTATNIAFQGNSASNRLAFKSSTLGTARTITCTSSVVASITLTGVSGSPFQTQYADFQDITAAGAAAWNVSGITGGSGDANGNTGITFAVGRTLYLVGNTSTATLHLSLALWSISSGGASGQSPPLAQDNLIVDRNSSTVNFTLDIGDYAWPCKDFDASDLANGAFTVTLNNSTQQTTYGNITMPTSHLAWNTGAAVSWNLGGRGSFTITSNGQSVGNTGVAFAAGALGILAPGGTYTLNGALTMGAAGLGGITVTAGTLNTNGFTVSCAAMTTASATATRTLTTTNSTVNLTVTTAQNIINILSTSGLTLNTTGTTWVVNTASTATRTVVGAGNNLGSLQYTVSTSPGILKINEGGNTFVNFDVETQGNAPKTVTWPSSATTTVSGVFTLKGTAVSGYVYVAGINNNGTNGAIATPSFAAANLTGDCFIAVKLAMDNWANASANQMLVSKAQTAGQLSWRVYVDTTGHLRLSGYSDGTTLSEVQSSAVIPGTSAGSALWLGISRTKTTGVVTFYTASGALTNPALGDFSTFGTTQTLLVNTAFFTGTSEVEVGSAVATTSANTAAKFYSVRIWTDTTQTTQILSPDFTTTATGLETSYTDAQNNVWTVNGAVNGIVYLNSSSGGTRATLSAGPSVGIWPVVLATITDSNATGGATFSATQSTLNNDVGWTSPALQSATDIVGMSNGVSQAVKTAANF